jgi:AcrR family transcriptional regulator
MNDGQAPHKAQARRDELAERIADHLLENGLGAATLRPIARAAGLSDRMLIYYFETRDAAVAAGLECAAGRLKDRLATAQAPHPLPAQALVDHLAPFILHTDQAPVMTLWLEIAGRAARGEAPYSAIAPSIAAGFLDWIRGQLDAPTATLEAEALSVLARLDGMALLQAAGLDLSAAQRLTRS